ncbi:hypothetical protein IKF76_00825 [Candidatus Saccharibacteria bacterium]|nr:hypothetical protein [Candidatus Saccharibacteria bacterium]
MKRFFAYLKRIDRTWIVIWAFIYLSFLSLGIFMPDFFGVTVLKYTGIFLNLIYSVQKFPHDHLLQTALFFTLLADTILVLDSTSIVGVFVFCIAQFFHMTRLSKIRPVNLLLYLSLISLLFGFSLIQNIPPIFALCLVYAGSLITNIVFSYRWRKKSDSIPANCSFFGFLLFLACDSCVAISYLSFTHALPYFCYAPANYLAWFFYYPSQLLIANSSKTFVKRKTMIQ